MVTNLRLVSITSFQARAERQGRQKDIILDLRKATHKEPGSAGATYRIFNAADDAQRCMSDPAVREAINTRQTACGCPPAMVLAQAYINGARHIDAIDRRIASYELRRMTIIRELELLSARRARRLEKASSEIIEGRNAAKGAGPTSVAGRRRSRRNELRYGLAIGVKNNPTFRGEIESLARALLVRNRASITDSLLTAAAAGIDLMRIRKVRATV